jgi:hypothetical protein
MVSRVGVGGGFGFEMEFELRFTGAEDADLFRGRIQTETAATNTVAIVPEIRKTLLRPHVRE